MNNNIKATPTQFMGDVFRSKTEAMFAYVMKVFQVENKTDSFLYYEPTLFSSPFGYTPDFLRVSIVNSKSFGHFSYYELFEIKPSMPTQSYINKISDDAEIIMHEKTPNLIDKFYLCVFNPYEKVFLVDSFSRDTNSFESNFYMPEWFKEKYFKMALEYRFDLARNTVN